MSKKTIVTTIALVSTLVISAGSAYAHMGGHNNGHFWSGNYNFNYDYNNGMGRGHRNGHYKGQAMQQTQELTEDQIANLNKLESEYVAKVNPLRQNLAVKSAEYTAIMSGIEPDPTYAGKVAGEIAKIKQDIQILNDEYIKIVEKEAGIEIGRGYHHSKGNIF